MHQHCTGSFWNVEFPRFLCVCPWTRHHTQSHNCRQPLDSSLPNKIIPPHKKTASHQQPQAPKKKRAPHRQRGSWSHQASSSAWLHLLVQKNPGALMFIPWNQSKLQRMIKHGDLNMDETNVFRCFQHKLLLKLADSHWFKPKNRLANVLDWCHYSTL